tara:strand:+ start:382 stop:567 length:186 start_codon:yes stop_codon:yes gene_type:complete
LSELEEAKMMEIYKKISEIVLGQDLNNRENMPCHQQSRPGSARRTTMVVVYELQTGRRLRI